MVKKTRYHRIDDPNTDVYDKIDEFFEEVKEEIGIREGPPEFERKKYDHCEPHEVVPRRLDGNTQMLLYKDKVVAVVTETRTRYNYVEFTFFKNLEGLL